MFMSCNHWNLLACFLPLQRKTRFRMHKRSMTITYKFPQDWESLLVNSVFHFQMDKNVGPSQIQVHVQKENHCNNHYRTFSCFTLREGSFKSVWDLALCLLLFLQNLPQHPFCPPASFQHLWQIGFWKQNIFTVQIAPRCCCCMFMPQSNEKDRKTRTICEKTSCDNLNVDVTTPTSLGNFPIIGKFPSRENSVLLTVVHGNQRHKCCKN